MKTTVVNLIVEDYDVMICRPPKWGNPFVIGRDGDRARVIGLYKIWIRNQPKLMAALPELRGKRLGCVCAPAPCHGDVLAELVDCLDGWEDVAMQNRPDGRGDGND